jgi:hypothetical protein
MAAIGAERDDTGRVLAFKDSNGDVFGFNPPSGGANLYQAEAVAQGVETYQVLILVNNTQTFKWVPFISCSYNGSRVLQNWIGAYAGAEQSEVEKLFGITLAGLVSSP